MAEGVAAVAPRPLILASRSPQRRAILVQLGLEFEVVVPAVAECESGGAEGVAAHNAEAKAAAVAAQRADALVLGVDTVVSAGDRLYGKPACAQEAQVILSALSGRWHTVTSGVCLVEDGRPRTGLCRTRVAFRHLNERLIEWYVQSQEWRDRAGGYAIQGRGAALVTAIEGDYTNVVGLPVVTLLDLLPAARLTAEVPRRLGG